jgi:hypothetical protein
LVMAAHLAWGTPGAEAPPFESGFEPQPPSGGKMWMRRSPAGTSSGRLGAIRTAESGRRRSHCATVRARGIAHAKPARAQVPPRARRRVSASSSAATAGMTRARPSVSW